MNVNLSEGVTDTGIQEEDRMNKRLLGLCLISTLFLAVSCGPKAGQDLAIVVGEARSLATAGQVDKALSKLSSYYTSRHYMNNRAILLWEMVQIEMGANRLEAALARFGTAAGQTPEVAVPVMNAIEARLIQEKKWAAVEHLLGIAKAKFKDSPATRTLLANGRIDLLMARDGYQGALAELRKVMVEWPDEAVARSVRVIGSAAFTAGDRQSGDALYSAALDCPAGYGLTQDAAAEGWMKMAARNRSAREMVARLGEINHRNVQPGVIIRLINGSYSVLLGCNERDTYQALFAMCLSLENKQMAGFDKILLGGMMLDISYFLEDFEAALRLIHEGAGAIGEEQKPQMIAKVRAHLAMKNKQPREAVKYFREFMGLIEKQNRDELDPLTGCQVTRDMILGLNAKRIGDLLISAGDPAEARKAYEEARGYYRLAFKKFQNPASKEYLKITKELAEIPEK
jgi:tetratricopeptide (TPR) repeat protein